MMKKTIAIGLCIIMLATFSTAVPKIKFYSHKIDPQHCIDLIESIPEIYYEGIKIIKIYDLNLSWLGRYLFSGRVIELTYPCEKDTLIHELSHHQQFLNKESYYEMLHHGKSFTYYHTKLSEALYYNE